MIPPDRNKTQANYDKLSGWYDWLAGAGEVKAQRAALKLLQPQPGERLLEIGFGTGGNLVALAQAMQPGGRVWGVDVSGGMCRVARGKIGAAGVSNVCLCQGDALTLPFGAHSFEAIFMSFALELLPAAEMPLVLRQCGRVLGENGRICLTAMSQTSQPTIMSKLYQWGHRQWPATIDCQPIDVPRVVAQAGFQVVHEQYLSMWGLPVAIVLGRRWVGDWRLEIDPSR
ncbi:MAG: methyltransferase domain-containing protein [Ardenticatenaceae bacterium]|nr:methyltransferase domain-containing protein [Ardenticatenaceae bacterium]